jgi:hypothetical protein
MFLVVLSLGMFAAGCGGDDETPEKKPAPAAE